ncbi:MAG: phosphoribosylglycinamide synthetase C domain-containing protein, partial [Halieaceae bacterium]
KVFHAGTAEHDGRVVTSGGRVLCVTALGDNIAAAQQDCYQAVDKISWDGVTLRRDIGWRAIERYSQGN